MLNLIVNRKRYKVDVPNETPLLWVLRDTIGLTGTKFGCGIGRCGACTVHMNGEAVRSCLLPVSSVEEMEIITIEGLHEAHNHPVQKAWKTLDVPQCGYCQSGQIMAAAALIKRNPNPSDEFINANMSNICRCGTYSRIRKAIRLAAEMARNDVKSG